MSDDTYNPTYLPGGPEDYRNYNYYAGNPEARPVSPFFAASMPNMMERQNQNAGNSAFAPPGGINFGNPAANIFGGMLLNMVFNGNVRPLQRPDMPAYDYFEARQRHSISMRMAPQIWAMDPSLARFGALGDNPLAQLGLDLFNPNGSQSAAFQSIYGRMGTVFGGSLENQANTSMSLLGQMNDAFRRGSSFDYKASYGFNREELVGALDAGVRYGIGGLSDRRLRESIEQGRGGDLARGQARIFAAAGDIFGKDKGFDELAQSMKSSIDGVSGMSENDVVSLLNKIQATARTINVSGKALAEYQTMLKNMNKSMGFGGTAAAPHSLDSAIQGSIVSQIGRETGDAKLGDLNAAMENVGVNRANTMDSPTMRKAMSIMAHLQQMTVEQRASVTTKGGMSLATAGDALKAAINSSDPAAIQRAVDSFAKVQNNPYFNTSQISRDAINLSDLDRERAMQFAPGLANVQGITGQVFANNAARNLSLNMRKDVVRQLGGQAGILNFLGGLSTEKEATSVSTVRAKLAASGRGLSDEQLDVAANQIAQGLNTELNDPRLARNFGFANTDLLKTAWAERSNLARERAGAARLQTSSYSNLIEQARNKSGDLMRNYGLGNLIDDAMNILPEMDGKEWNVKNVGSALQKIGRDASGADAMIEMQELFEKQGGMKGIKAKLEGIKTGAKDVYDKEMMKSGSAKIAARKSSEYFTSQVASEGLSALLGGSMENAPGSPASAGGSSPKSNEEGTAILKQIADSGKKMVELLEKKVITWNADPGSKKLF